MRSDGKRWWFDMMWVTFTMQDYDHIHSCMFALVWLELTHVWVTFEVICCRVLCDLSYTSMHIYIQIQSTRTCSTLICYHLTLMVLVHAAWCELEDQIGILSTTCYQGEPMSPVWPLYCSTMVLGIRGSKERKEWGQQVCPSFNFPSR
jgi:hypothetical protein